MTQDDARTNLLLPENVRRRLDPLMLVARRIRAGAMKGERRSVKRGTSIEFADYRDYTPGDDLRKLDWNVYARLERPYIKLLEDEEDLAVHILLDNSASMDFPKGASEREINKLLYAQRLFASLAYISLTTGDRLMLSLLSDTGWNPFGPSRGRGQVVPMLQYVHDVEAGGIADLNVALKNYALRERRKGLVIIISDLMSPAGHRDGLNALVGKGHEVTLIHVVAPDELEPPHTGDLRLIDAETHRAQEVSVDATMRAIYERRVQEWLADIRDDASRKGVHYLLARTDTLWDRVLLYDLRRLGLIK